MTTSRKMTLGLRCFSTDQEEPHIENEVPAEANPEIRDRE